MDVRKWLYDKVLAHSGSKIAAREASYALVPAITKLVGFAEYVVQNQAFFSNATVLKAQAALDAYVQEKVDRERDRLRAIENQKWEFWLTGLCEDIRSGKEDDVDVRVLAAIREREAKAVLAESEWCLMIVEHAWSPSEIIGALRERLAANRAKVETKT